MDERLILPRRRVPKFTPVPLRYRSDGWTPMRQAEFLGALAETWSVTEAARRVGMTRESAYRLRGKFGAESFAAAWDAILATPRGIRKSTHELLWHRLFYGTLKPVMRGGKHAGTLASPDNDGLLRLYRQEMQRRHPPPGRQLQGRELALSVLICYATLRLK